MPLDNPNYPYKTLTTQPEKPPRMLLENLYAFSPNRETLGGTSYFIVEKTGNILIDCPIFNEFNQQFLLQKGVHWLFLTHRGGHSKHIKQLQTSLNCQILIQEQEAYLLPEISITPFEQEVTLSSNCYGLWTPGHSPGSACLYWSHHGGVLFSGRHLLPNQQLQLLPLRTAKTFHWLRQLRSVEFIRQRFNRDTLRYLCPGANTGFLRGKVIIDNIYESLSTLDLENLKVRQDV